MAQKALPEEISDIRIVWLFFEAQFMHVFEEGGKSDREALTELSSFGVSLEFADELFRSSL